MASWLRRLMWPFERMIQEFLESDLSWVRLMFIAFSALLLLVVAVIIQFFVDPDSGQGLLTQSPGLVGVPLPILRVIGIMMTPQSLRFLLLPAITLTIAMLAGARYIQDIYDLNIFGVAFRYLFASLFGRSYPSLRIENGRMLLNPDEINPLAVIGGPGNLTISPGNAVLTEHLRRPAEVRGPGSHFISRFESIKEIVDLRDQQGYIEKASAMSKDGMIVTVHDIRYRYRLYGGMRASGHTGRSLDNPYPFSVQAVRNLVYNRSMSSQGTGEWAQVVRGAIQGAILNHVRNNRMDNITAPGIVLQPGETREEHNLDEVPDPRADIRNAMKSGRMRARLRGIGAELLWFDIGRFSFEDPAVEEQRISTWAADWVGNADVVRAYGEAQRQAYDELARAEAQAELMMSLVHSLHEAGLSGDLRGNSMRKLVLLKTAQVLEAMSSVYHPIPDEDEDQTDT